MTVKFLNLKFKSINDDNIEISSQECVLGTKLDLGPKVTEDVRYSFILYSEPS
jgi:hypothetical protein